MTWPHDTTSFRCCWFCFLCSHLIRTAIITKTLENKILWPFHLQGNWKEQKKSILRAPWERSGSCGTMDAGPPSLSLTILRFMVKWMLETHAWTKSHEKARKGHNIKFVYYHLTHNGDEISDINSFSHNPKGETVGE